MKRTLQRLLAVAAATVAFAAQAGGPLGTCYGSPIKYGGTGSVTLNYDRGSLGARTKAQADTLVTNSVSLWTNVGTSTVALTRGADLAVDVTTSNFSTYNSFSDGINPVIYDHDGTIIDMMLGTGARNSTLGFAGSAWTDNGSVCQYREGRAVINGFLSVSDATMAIVLAHEIGHLIGLDHTQLDSVQGLASSNYPLMYPIAVRTLQSLHEDDVAAVTALYPDSNVNTVYGTVTGSFVTGGGTAIRGANIWAQGSPGTFSVVSDYLGQGTGYFKFLLPPGTYTLHAEAIDSSFIGGSSVGPYSETSSGASFQSPNYVNGSPMAPVTMTPQITVTAGCAGTVTFRNDGTGTVGGNCGPVTAPSEITSPTAGSTLGGSSATFGWSAGSGVTERYLSVGTTVGGTQIYSGYQGSSLSRAVSGLPTNGSTVHVRLRSWINSAWQTRDYTYTAFTQLEAQASTITSPAPGSTLLGGTVTFSWTAGGLVTSRFLSVGTTPGGTEIYGADQGTELSRSVSGLPTNGSTVYVRLRSTMGTVSESFDYQYTAVLLVEASAITSPAPGSTLTSSSATFSWSAGSGVTERYLMVGTSAGGGDLYAGYQGTALSRTVSGLPTNGGTIYVRLQSWIGSSWRSYDYTYTASGTASEPAPAPGPSVLTTPAPGTTLASTTVTFEWSAGSGVSERYFAIGTTAGGSNIYGGYQGSALSRSVSGLPSDGSTVYVRLMSWVNSAWQVADYTYIAIGGAVAATPSTITSPTAGSTLGTSATFAWTSGSGVTERYLAVGTTAGGSDIYGGYQGSSLSRTVSGIPTNGATVHVTLLSWISGGWQTQAYVYTAATP